MIKGYYGRDWKWWIRTNGHYCHFCYSKNPEAVRSNIDHPGRLGLQCLKKRGTNRGQYTRGYWNTLYHIWLKHMEEYHLDIVADWETRGIVEVERKLTQ